MSEERASHLAATPALAALMRQLQQDARSVKRLALIFLSALLTLVTVVFYSCHAVNITCGNVLCGQSQGDSKTLALVDFVPFYTAALLCRDALGKKIDIYDPDVQRSYASRVTPEQINQEKPRCLQSPPYVFAFLLPFSLLKMSDAWLCWAVASLAAAACAMWRLSTLATKSALEQYLACLLFFSSFPAWLCVGQGQTAMFIFAGMVLFFSFLLARRFLSAGMSLLIISSKLQFLPACVTVGVVFGRLPFLGGLAATGLILLLLSGFTVGWTNVINYPHALLTAETGRRFEGVSAITMQNVRGMFSVIFGSDARWINITSGVISLAALGAVAMFWNQYRGCEKTDTSSGELLIAATIPVMLITSLHAHVYDYMYLAITYALLWRNRELLGEWNRSALTVSLLLFVPASWLFAMGHAFLQHVYIQPYPLWSLVPATIAWQAVLNCSMRSKA